MLGRDDVALGSWPVSGSGPPGLAVVEYLARLQLSARRRGQRIVVHQTCRELQGLLELAGLCGQLGGQVEQGEKPLGAEEAVEPGDPVA
jgi:hypothetical protein